MPQIQRNQTARKPFVADKVVRVRPSTRTVIEIICPVCGQGVQKKKDGTPYRHKVGTYNKFHCLGGEPVYEEE